MRSFDPRSDRMTSTLIDWTALHAPTVASLLLLLGVLAGDLAWQRSARLKVAAMAGGRHAGVMRWRTGVLLMVAGTVVFASLAFAVAMGDPGTMAGIDTALAQELHERASPTLLQALATFTDLASQPWIVGGSLLVLFVLLLRGEWWLSLVWSVAQIGILPLSLGIKSLVERPRPLHSHGFVVEQGWSFPSGHAVSSIVFYGMLAYVLLRIVPSRWHRAIIAVTVALVGSIGISRILLQVHYLSDVMAGFALGLAWLVLCMACADWLRLRSLTKLR